jgi:hypothetical protein
MPLITRQLLCMRCAAHTNSHSVCTCYVTLHVGNQYHQTRMARVAWDVAFVLVGCKMKFKLADDFKHLVNQTLNITS